MADIDPTAIGNIGGGAAGTALLIWGIRWLTGRVDKDDAHNAAELAAIKTHADDRVTEMKTWAEGRVADIEAWAATRIKAVENDNAKLADEAERQHEENESCRQELHTVSVRLAAIEAQMRALHRDNTD